jgi:hypothetical protein
MSISNFALDLPDVEAIKIFRSDQSYKYISITKETTAKEVVRLALREFGYAEDEIQGLTSDNEPQYSLSKVSCQVKSSETLSKKKNY